MVPKSRGGYGAGRNKRTFDRSSKFGPRKPLVKSRVEDITIEGDDDRSSLEPERRVEDDFTEEDVGTFTTSDEDSADEAPAQSYNDLLKGFAQDDAREGPRRKRRKLDRRSGGDTDDLQRGQAESNGASYDALLSGFAEPAQKKRRQKKEHALNGNGVSMSKRSAEVTALPLEVEEEDGASEDPDFEPRGSDLEEGEDDEDESADEDSDEENTADPFEAHLNPSDTRTFESNIQSASSGLWTSSRIPFGSLGNAVFSVPKGATHPPPKRVYKDVKHLPFLKQKLQEPAENNIQEFNEVQRALAPTVFDYQDVLLGARTIETAKSLRQLACLHSLNHVFKTRDRILKNNTRIAKDNEDGSLEIRDQGFTRPKVLFLLETRQNCAKFLETIIDLADPEQIENKKRFLDSFSSTNRHPEDMPDDFRELFDGNDDNVFRVGLKFTRKNLKIFSQFYASDIIFASPLGLRLAIEGKGSKHRDSDFLSSIEMVVLDQADAMLMQNWEHVDYVFEHLNLQPKESHGCDYGRVRHWYLDGNAKYLRQTLVFSAFITPTLLGLLSKHMRNIEGRIKYQPTYTGAIADPSARLLRIKQTFSRFQGASPSADPDARFQHFTTTVLPALARLPKPAEGGHGILIFVPSHADFSRLQNFFATSNEATNISFGAISEFTQPSEVRRARAHFERGRQSMLLYSARAHHFRRYRIKGVRKVVFHGLPDNPTFYREVVGGFLGASAADGKVRPEESAVRVMFSKWDLLALERIVGSARVAALTKDGAGGDTFDFV